MRGDRSRRSNLEKQIRDCFGHCDGLAMTKGKSLKTNKMKVPVYNKEGKSEGEATLPKEVFEVPMNADLVHQVLISLSANKRQGSAHTKNRGEVRGGGKKPWRQKGTGRARHGSIRSPLWVGGGVTFGPRNDKNWEREIPKKMKRKALFMVLSEKAKNDLVVLLDEFATETGKTKEMAKLVKALPCAKDSRLIAMAKDDKKLYLSARNIAKTKIDSARNLNILDLLNYKYLLMDKEAIKIIKDTFSKK